MYLGRFDRLKRCVMSIVPWTDIWEGKTYEKSELQRSIIFIPKLNSYNSEVEKLNFTVNINALAVEEHHK